MSERWKFASAFTGLLLAGGLAVSGCGSSSSTRPSATPSDGITQALPSPTFTGPNAAFCNAYVSLGQASVNLQAAQSGGDQAAVDSALQTFTTTAQSLATTVPDSAPAQVKAGLKTLAVTIGKIAREPTADPANAAVLRKALATVQPYLTSTCPTS